MGSRFWITLAAPVIAAVAWAAALAEDTYSPSESAQGTSVYRRQARSRRSEATQSRPHATTRKPGRQPIRDQHVEPAFFPAPMDEAQASGLDEDAALAAATTDTSASLEEALPGEHPLMPAIRWAKNGMQLLEDVQDYSAVLVKRERINGELSEPEWMYVKVRHNPFSVYTRFLVPKKKEGQEAIYVSGQNSGKLVAHGVGIEKFVGTVQLLPTGDFAMRGNRYPITELGIRRLTERLIEVGENDSQYGECEVKVTKGAKIKDRTATVIQVIHPTPRREFLFHVARIYVDDKLNLPTRYEAYEWPQQPGGKPVLVEEYTYLDLKLNNGFTDADFDHQNPDYDYR